MSDLYNTKYSDAYYDPATGTFYCEGIPMRHSSLDKIMRWYKAQMDVYKDRAARDHSAMEFYMRYAVAYNAILLLDKGLKN